MITLSPISRCSLSALAFITTSLSAQSILMDFDTSASFSNNLTKGVANYTLGNYGESSGTGLNSSGSFFAPTGSDNFSYSVNTAFDGNSTTFTTSTYVKIKDQELTGGAISLAMGFSNLSVVDTNTVNSPTGIPDPSPAGGGSQYSLAIVLRGEASASASDGVNDSYRFTSYSNGSFGSQGSLAELNIGDWYYWESNISRAGDDYTLNAQLFASDSSGTVSGSAIISFDAVIANASLAAESDVYGFIGSQNGSRRGIERMDNMGFSAIPESSTYGAILGLVVIAFIGTCRRSR